MKIQAAAYGCEHLVFLADSASDADVAGLLALLSKSGITHNVKRDAKAYQEVDLKNQETYAGNLVISSQEGILEIEGKTKLTLMPYLRRLRQPKFISGEINGEHPIREVLGQYDFLVIEAIDQQAMTDYKARFSDIAGPVIRVQPQRDQEMSVAIGRSWLELAD